MARDRRTAQRESLNSFLFDVEKFFGSIPVQRMSFAEKGVYLVMLFQQWRAGALPDSAEAVAEVIAVTEAQRADVIAAWPMVRRKFVTREDDPQWIQNVTLEDTRRAQRRYLKDRRDAGKRGGENAAYNRRQRNHLSATPQLQHSYSTAVAELQQKVGVSKGKVSRVSKGKEREVREVGEEDVCAEPLTRSTPAVLTFPTVGAVKAWDLSEEQVSAWAALYPQVDIVGEARRALAWVLAASSRRKTAKGMRGFLVNWFNRSADRGGLRVAGGGEVSAKGAENLANVSRLLQRMGQS